MQGQAPQHPEDYDKLNKDIYQLIALVELAELNSEHLDESLSRIKEEAKTVKERRAKSRSQ